MEKQEKELTKNQEYLNNMPITDSLEAFNILLKVGINQDMSIPEISDKTGINKQVIYRYTSQYESQKKTFPTFKTLLRLCKVFGYEIVLKKIDKQNC